MSFSNPITGGQGTLVRPAIKSPDYVQGVSGWSINRDGSAEFNDLSIRGTFNGTNYVIDADGIFLYSGAPAAGNLAVSVTNAAGIDTFGNHYLSGITAYDWTADVYTNLQSGFQQFGSISGGIPDTIEAASIIAGGSALDLLSQISALAGFTSRLSVQLNSGIPASPIGSQEPFLGLTATDGNPASLRVSGAVIKTDTGGSPIAWQNPAYGANWGGTTTLNGNTGFATLQFHVMPDDSVWVHGAALSSGTGTTVFTLPAAYRPPTGKRAVLPCWIFHAGAQTTGWAQVTEAGVVAVNSSISGVSIASGDQLFINGSFPRRNVS